MFDTRIYFAQMTSSHQPRIHRPHDGHPAQRVYRLPAERRPVRDGQRGR